MKYLFSLLLCACFLPSEAQLKREDLVVNDSLGVVVTDTANMSVWINKYDSVNRVMASCGVQKYFQSNLLTLRYVNGLGYVSVDDSLFLYLVDFRVQNSVNIRKLELYQGMTLERFEKEIRRCECRNSREEIERVKGTMDVVYTVYSDDTGVRYRVFFSKGVLQLMILHIPCE